MRRFRAQGATLSVCLAMTLSAVFTASGQEVNYLSRIKELGLQNIDGKIPAYYSAGHREHAELLQSRIGDMNAFFQTRSGVQANVSLAFLDSKGWTDVTGAPYGIAMVSGNPPVIFMPATPDNPTFDMVRARKESIPPETLRLFLQANQIPFEGAVSQFVDLVGFHELGHVLTLNFGMTRSLSKRISRQLLVLRVYLGTAAGLETRLRSVRTAFENNTSEHVAGGF